MSTIIHCHQVTKLFGAHKALDNVSFEVTSGAPVALVGPNGAGKTTLFSILCGYLNPTSGSATIFGQTPGSAAQFGRLSALPQDALLDPRFSIGHQLRFYGRLQGMSKRQQQSETERCLELVGLVDCMNQRPGELSHGMRKRITIAQALLGSPELVMLDEATAGLDPKNARQIRDLVAELSAEITFILSSHDLHELERLCDSVLFLEHGKLEHQPLSHSASEDTLTLRMQHYDAGFIPSIETLTGMIKVEQRPQKEFILHFDPNVASDMHLQVLSICHNNQWAYKQLIAGKTLEDQLFD